MRHCIICNYYSLIRLQFPIQRSLYNIRNSINQLHENIELLRCNKLFIFPVFPLTCNSVNEDCQFHFLHPSDTFLRGSKYFLPNRKTDTRVQINNEITASEGKAMEEKLRGLLPFNSRAINLHSMVVSHVLGGILTSDTLDTCTSRQT